MSENTYSFQTEARQLLDLMIHSVYSHKEIFMRELISNASDALDKLRFEALTKDAFRPFIEDQHIRITPDTTAKTLSIADNGIGMNHEEIIKFIGTIAKSGTKEFSGLLNEAKDNKESLPNFIGQFGVGFYSSFMVASKVELITRKASEKNAWKWESTGDGTYTIAEATRDTCGTTVILHLKKADNDDDEAQDFTSEWTVRETVKKYSDFVAYPIRMSVSRTKIERDENGKPKEGAKEETVIEDEVLNSMKAIWTKSSKDVKEQEYKDFYKHISHDWSDPLKWFSYRAEGVTGDFCSLIFIPSKPPFDMMFPNTHHGINLYIKRVFIMNDCKELIPEYLRFIRGVVDSDELSLNISREILQQNKQIQVIKKAITKKVLDTFKSMLKEERASYLEFWKNFGQVIKEGLFKETGDHERLFEACLFASTASESDGFTLGEYVERMKEGQGTIYYLTGDSLEILKSSPHLEAFKDKGYEVLLLTDPVDEIWVQFTRDYKGKKFKSVGKGEIELGSEEERKKQEETRKEKETHWKPMLEVIKNRLDADVKEVRLSSRLTTSPACIVSEAHEMSPHLEALLKASGKEVTRVKRILELNPNHPLLEKMHRLYQSNSDDPRIKDYAVLLFGQAVLSEGGKLENPTEFSSRLSELMAAAF